MKNNFKHRFLAITLSLALMLNSGAMAFATEGMGGVTGEPVVTTSEQGDLSDPEGSDNTLSGEGVNKTDCTCDPVPGVSGVKGHGTDCPLYDCTCDPVPGASGVEGHGKGCPLYEKLQTEALKAVLELIDALPTMDELTVQDTEGAGFSDYLAKLRLDTAAARAAYNALTDKEKASFDPAVLAKLTELEGVLAAMPVLMTGENAITITVTDGTTPKTGIGGTSLSDAVTKSGLTASAVTKLTITAGEVTADDWIWLKNLNKLTDFTVVAAPDVTAVANIPDLNVGSTFPKSIVSVTIPQAITIGKQAFMECNKLTTASIPNATRISNQAFQNCTLLATVYFPNATSIGSGAFRECKALVTTDFTKASNIGENAFTDCKLLESVSFPSLILVSNYALSDCTVLKTASFPKATNIKDGAFSGCTSLITLNLGAAVPTGMTVNTFANCPNDRSVVIMDADSAALATAKTEYDKVVSLDTGTADDGLWFGWKITGTAVATANITITVTDGTNTKTGIGGTSLSDAITKSTLTESDITKLTITAGKVTTADWTWFANNGTPVLTALTNFTVDSAVTTVASIPEATGTGSTFPKSIVSVTIPQKIYIGAKAFSGCVKLSTVDFPLFNDDIANFVFDGCTALETVNIPLATSIGGYAFRSCTSLKSVTFNNVAGQYKSIGSYAFAGCTSLKTVTIPNVLSINSSAFKGCTALTDAIFTKATFLGESAFEGCASLKSVSFPLLKEILSGGSNGGGTFEGCVLLVDATFPEVKEIGKNAFKGCKALLNADFQIATKIGSSAFEGCAALASTSFPLATEIGYSAFEGCAALESANFPLVNTKIGDSAFNGCAALESTSFPFATKIGSSAFMGCTALASTSFPEVTEIDTSAFKNCTSLKSVNFPLLTSIGFYAFQGCTSLKSVTCPLVTGISMDAFDGCAVLVELKLGATPPTCRTDSFTNCPPMRSLMLVGADGTTELTGDTLTTAQGLYKAAADGNTNDKLWYGWMISGGSVTANKITIKINNVATEHGGASLQAAVTTALNGAALSTITKLTITAGEVTAADWTWFANNGTPVLTALTDFTIADNIAVTAVADIPEPSSNRTFPQSIVNVTIPQAITIGKNVFDKCKALKTASFPAATSIGMYAFYNCTELTTTNFSKVTSIGTTAFGGCEKLQSISFPVATSIGVSAFVSCSSLTTISFPVATSIGERAFGHCKKLQSISFPEATSIGVDAFGYCTELTTTNFPKATSIGDRAFDACKKLQSISFPAVTSIGKYAFYNCTALAMLKLGATVPTVTAENAFKDCPTTRNLVLVNANGSDLTGTDLTTAQGNYKTANDGNTTDDLWYGWKIGGSGINVAVTGVTLDKTTLSLAMGKSETLTATVAPATATNKAVTWRTSNAAVATVTDGVVSVLTAGSATITVTTTDGGKTATCAVTVTAATSKPAPGGKLDAPLTQDNVDGVFGEGNATLGGTTTPPTIKLENDITPEKPIEIEPNVKIDLGGNTITGKPGQPPLIIGNGTDVDIVGGGTVAGGDNSDGTGGNGITGGTGSDITIGGGVTVEGGDGATGGDGINSGGNVTIDNGTVSGGNGSSGSGGDGVDTSVGTGNITIKPDGSANGGDSTGGNGSGGDGTSSGGSTTIDGDVTGGDGNGSGSGGNGATGGNGDIIINGGGSAQGGNGGTSGGAGGDGIDNNGGGNTTVGGDTNGGNGGNNSSGTGGAGGNGTTTDSGSTTVNQGGNSTGGAGGNSSTAGGIGGNGTDSSGNNTTINGGATGGAGGNGTSGSNGNGGNGGSGANQGSGTTVNGSGTATGGNGGSGAGTGTGGSGGAGVGGGAAANDTLNVKNGISARVEVEGDAKSTVKLPDPAKTVDAVLTQAEKADTTITDVKVTLKVDDKTANKPDEPAIEAQKPLNSIIGAFFDITMQKTISKNNVAGIPELITNVPNGFITITIEIPSNMRDGVVDSYVIIRMHNGSAMRLSTTQAGTDLTFETDKFSTYAIAYTKSTTTQPVDNTGGGSDNSEYEFWGTVHDKIDSAKSGDVIKINAKANDKILESVMEALRKNNVTLIINWDGGKTITIPAGKAPKYEVGRIYWPISKLVDMYAGKNGALNPAEYVNPETGGTGTHIPVTGGDMYGLNAPNAIAATASPDADHSTGNTAKTSALDALAVVSVGSPTAGVVADAEDAKRASSGKVFAVMALMLAAVAVGSGVWFWESKTQTKEQQDEWDFADIFG